MAARRNQEGTPKAVLESILKDREAESLPAEWQWRKDELFRFSRTKSLYKFQQEALKKALLTLWLYYGQFDDCGRGLPEGVDLRGLYRRKGLGEIPVNQMGFWMATGSGKTLVIVKLIEMLSFLGDRVKNFPKLDIMFLVYRENLLKQFQSHVDEYNSFTPSKKINLIDLQNYERIKHENALSFSNSVNVFYYRADLFFEEKKTEKKIRPRSCDNNGKWFVLLDEAHRGVKNESKLQQIYGNFARNGFLFNFSATFTEPVDINTCAYNFNLEKFIGDGYGKNIYISGADVRGFQQKDAFSDIEKQRIVLKTLILQTYVKQNLAKIRGVKAGMYHNPLLLGIVNSVTKKESDLVRFFVELEKIGSGNIANGLFEEARDELCSELKGGSYFFGSETMSIDRNALSAIEYNDVLEAVFNTAKPGKIEAIRVPGNKQELIFKVQTSERAFALIRIGDITKWVKEILVDANYEIIEKYEEASIFSQLNEDDSDINILMGSRTFYEGWDSNRPNIILFVNIGVGKNSKKFVLQSVGRGVRIEPTSGKRKRLQSLVNAGDISSEIFDRIQDNAPALESLFVFGTDANNLREVISSLRSEKTGDEVFTLGSEFVVNSMVKDKVLLVPCFKDSRELLAEKQSDYPISQKDLDETRVFFENMGEKVMVAKYGVRPKTLKKTLEIVKIMNAGGEKRVLNNPSFFVSRLIDYCQIVSKEMDEFRELDASDIVHFEKIQFIGTKEECQELRAKLAIMRNADEERNKLKQAYGKVPLEEYDRQRDLFEDAKQFENISIKNLANHYYNPMLLSKYDRLEYFRHIIDVQSEGKFIETLEKQVEAFDRSCDWWVFSKIDPSWDTISIPYIGTSAEYSLFYPDFIFWFGKGSQYRILFLDPKGTAHSSYEHKADWFETFFCTDSGEKLFVRNEKEIKVYLRFFGEEDNVGKKYRNYWIDCPSKIPSVLG